MHAQAMDRPLRPPIAWRSERTLFTAGALLLFLYVAVRAARVPITFEEAERFFRFIQQAGLKPLGAPWGAADQPFTVVLADVLVRLFGDGRVVLRIPAVLCFPLYAWYVWRCGSVIGDPLIRRCTLAALVALPLVLDFFSLFFGHGPATAFLLVGLWHTAAFLHASRRGDPVWALLALFAACLGSPVLFPLFGLLGAVLGVVYIRNGAGARARWIRAAQWLPGVVVLALLINGSYGTAVASQLMRSPGDDSITGALVRHVAGDNLPIFRWMAVTAFLICAVTAGRVLLRRERTPAGWLLVLATGTILVDLTLRMVAYRLGGAAFPPPASTIHMAPLFVLACAITLEHFAATVRYRRWAALVLLVFPLRTLFALNTSVTVLWPREAVPDAFYAQVAAQQQAAGRASYVAGMDRMALCWSFGVREHAALALPTLHVRDVTQGDFDAVLAERHQSAALAGRYRMVAEVPHGGLRLFLREPALATRTVNDTLVDLPMHRNEFKVLLERPAAELRGKALWVELKGGYTADTLPGEPLLLVTEMRDSTDQQLRYEAFELVPAQVAGPRRVLVTAGLGTVPDNAHRLSTYIWDRTKSTYAFTHARLRLHTR